MFEIMNITGWGSGLMRDIGSLGFEFFVNPLIWWTILAICLLPIIKWIHNRNVHLAYQINLSTLLLLPLSMVLSLVIWSGKEIYSTWLQRTGSVYRSNEGVNAINQGIVNIGSIEITQSTASQIDVSYWLGLLFTGLLLISMWQLIQFLFSRMKLQRFARTEHPIPPQDIANISRGNIALTNSISRSVRFILMEDKHIPLVSFHLVLIKGDTHTMTIRL